MAAGRNPHLHIESFHDRPERRLDDRPACLWHLFHEASLNVGGHLLVREAESDPEWRPDRSGLDHQEPYILGIDLVFARRLLDLVWEQVEGGKILPSCAYDRGRRGASGSRGLLKSMEKTLSLIPSRIDRMLLERLLASTGKLFHASPTTMTSTRSDSSVGSSKITGPIRERSPINSLTSKSARCSRLVAIGSARPAGRMTGISRLRVSVNSQETSGPISGLVQPDRP